MSRNRNWCFTINNYTSDDLTRLFEHTVDIDGVIETRPATVMDDEGKPKSKCNNISYLICAKETGESGTPHLQGYIEFINARSLMGVKKLMPTAHLEIRLSSALNASNYCKKGDQPHSEWEEFRQNGPNFGRNANYREYGTISAQGTRTDLKEIKNDIFSGKKVDDIALESPMLFHQYGRTLNKLEDLAMRQRFRSEMTTGTWYYGPTNVGKSHAALKDFHPSTHYIYPNDGGWWDGYTQQDTVIFNDFRGEIDFNHLLQLIDKWPHFVRRRNREPMPFTSKHIIITSSHHPSMIYDPNHDDINQLLRRITLIKVSIIGDTITHSIITPQVVPPRQLTLRVIKDGVIQAPIEHNTLEGQSGL